MPITDLTDIELLNIQYETQVRIAQEQKRLTEINAEIKARINEHRKEKGILAINEFT